MKRRVKVLGIAAALALVGVPSAANAVVTVFPATQPDPSNPTPEQQANTNFFNTLTIPPGGAFDERGFSSFQYMISNDGGDALDMGDQFITFGEDRKVVGSSLPADLGATNLSGKRFGFSLQHNYVGSQRNFTFTLNEMGGDGISSTLCWGVGCDPSIPAGNQTETLGGEGPIANFNGLQLQVRAQEVPGARTEVKITGLTGVDLAPGTTFYDEIVENDTTGTLCNPIFCSALPDNGRQGQWLVADDNDLTLNDWELTGEVTLFRDDDASDDVTKVRFKVDLVQDPSQPFGAVVPIPGAVWLFGTGLVALLGVGRWRREQAT